MSRTEPFALSFTFTSDWHVGTGAGRHGSVDREVARDGDGLPCVPEGTVIGMWRDAAERVVAGLAAEGGDHENWESVLLWLFGDQPALSQHKEPPKPWPAAVDVTGPGRLSEALRAGLTGDDAWRRRLRRSLFVVKPGVKIDPRSDTARDDFLRTIEYARAGLSLSVVGNVRMPADEAAHGPIRALMNAAALAIEGVGGKRRRGAGQCTVTLERDGTPIDLEETIAALQTAPPEIKRPCRRKSTGGTGTAFAGHDWLVMPLHLEVLTPLVVSEEVRGNVIRALHYLPAARLLPWLEERLGSVGLDLPALLAADRLRVLPAHPDVGGRRGLPVPASYHRPKEDKKAGVRNALVDDKPSPAQEKPMRQGWLGVLEEEAVAWLEHPPVVRHTHATIEDARQRPSATVGGVYSLEGLAAGTRLRSELWLRVDLDDQGRLDLAEALTDTTSFGTARKANGRVRAHAEGAASPEIEVADLDAGSPLFVWLTSDLLLRDEALGSAATSADVVRALARASGVEEGEVKRADVHLRHHRQESWHGQWRRPRPSLVGFAAGSCLTLTFDVPVAGQTLARLVAEGLGDRRGEGFGRVVLQDPRLSRSGFHPTPASSNPPTATAAPLALEGEERELARRIERTAFRRALQDAAVELAADDAARAEWTGWTADKPSGAQLGNLRRVLQGMSDASALADWADATERRQERWPQAALERLRALGGVGQRQQESDAFWSKLEQYGLIVGDTIGYESRDELHREMAAEAIKITLLAAMRAHRRWLERRAKEVVDGA